MNETQVSLPALLSRPGSRTASNRGAPPALQTCLIVSRSARRARWLAQAAQEEHWSTIICHSAEEALRQATRQRIQLSLVDMQASPEEHAGELCRLVEQLAARHVLLAVCGHADDAAGEVWARKLGVWMYLPGVESESDLASVYAQARQVVNKLGDHLAPAGN